MARHKLAKFAELEILDNVFQPHHEEVFRVDYRLKGKWGTEVFHNTNPIVLEVGCGKGEYCIGLGKLYPDRNFIGVDVKGARIWHGAKQAKEEELQNVAFVRAYAETLDSLFAAGEISEIWITFPDPQLTKARKRLTGTRFLSLYRNFMDSNGIVNLKTDSPFLYTYTSELVKENKLETLVNTDDLYGCGMNSEILGIKTFYERQWLARHKTIKYIRFRIGSNLLSEPTADIELDDYHSQAMYMNRKTPDEL